MQFFHEGGQELEGLVACAHAEEGVFGLTQGVQDAAGAAKAGAVAREVMADARDACGIVTMKGSLR